MSKFYNENNYKLPSLRVIMRQLKVGFPKAKAMLDLWASRNGFKDVELFVASQHKRAKSTTRGTVHTTQSNQLKGVMVCRMPAEMKKGKKRCDSTVPPDDLTPFEKASWFRKKMIGGYVFPFHSHYQGNSSNQDYNSFGSLNNVYDSPVQSYVSQDAKVKHTFYCTLPPLWSVVVSSLALSHHTTFCFLSHTVIFTSSHYG